jgi:protocatechuate 3,4-dioxygenase beta subunit
MTKDREATVEELTRRRALGLIVGTGAAFALGCGVSSSSDGSEGDGGAKADAGVDAASGGDAASSADTATGVDAGACEATPEGEIGPYFADDSASAFNRSNVLSNIDGTSPQTGVPLTLTVTVVDTEKSCAPYVGAQIDMWQCNASGVYSDIAGENTTTESWLRGYQLTDANGRVTFTTIVPGWYAGRTTHIHLRIRSTYSDTSSTSDGTNTTQVFFDQTLVDTLSTTVSPYDTEGANPTTNASDRVYSQQVDGVTLLTLVGDMTNGYTAAITLGLPIGG